MEINKYLRGCDLTNFCMVNKCSLRLLSNDSYIHSLIERDFCIDEQYLHPVAIYLGYSQKVDDTNIYYLTIPWK